MDNDDAVFWADAPEGDGARGSRPDTPAYSTYRPEDDPRRYCDKCTACLVYKCNGITARHHFIHLDEFEYFQQSDEQWEQGLLRDPKGTEHTDRNRGM